MDQRIFPDVPLKPCPVCGADSGARSWFKTLKTAQGGNYVSLKIGNSLYANDFNIVNCNPLVCTRCGYVQFFVDVQELQVKLNIQ